MKNFNIRKLVFIMLGFVSLVSIVFLVSIFTKQPGITVIKTTPADNTADVADNSNIDIVFNKTPTTNDQQKISIVISPQVDAVFEWSGDHLVIAPKKSFGKGVTYSIVVNYGGISIYKFSFETMLFTREQIQKEGPLQSQADKDFGDIYTKFITSSPWYLKIPIETTSHRIVYDFDKQKFRIRLKVPLTIDQQTSTVTNAVDNLKTIGVPSPINYYVLDKNGDQL